MNRILLLGGGLRLSTTQRRTKAGGSSRSSLVVMTTSGSRPPSARTTRSFERRHGEAAVAEHLEQRVRHVRVGLVDLVDEQHGDGAGVVGPPSNASHSRPRLTYFSLLPSSCWSCASASRSTKSTWYSRSSASKRGWITSTSGGCVPAFRGGAGDLALAAARLAAHEQRPARGPGEDQRIDLRLAPQVAGRREAVGRGELERGRGSGRRRGFRWRVSWRSACAFSLRRISLA